MSEVTGDLSALCAAELREHDLRRAVRKAVHDLNLAECGEGYQLNVPAVKQDLERALRSTAGRSLLEQMERES